MKRLSLIFTGSSRFSLIGWICLVFFPAWQYTPQVTFSVVIMLCMIYTYSVFLGRHLDDPGEKMKGHFWSLRGVMSLFKTPRAVLGGWVHFLAFDLLTGLIITMDAARSDISHWFVIPCLLLTLMFGPAGLLLYFVLQLFFTGSFPDFITG